MKIIIDEKMIEPNVFYIKHYLYLFKEELQFEEEIKQEIDLNFKKQFKVIQKIY